MNNDSLKKLRAISKDVLKRSLTEDEFQKVTSDLEPAVFFEVRRIFSDVPPEQLLNALIGMFCGVNAADPIVAARRSRAMLLEVAARLQSEMG